MKKLSINAGLTGFWVLIVLCFQWMWLSSIVHSISPEKVPDPLTPWVDWVLDDEKSIGCPWVYSDDKERRCAWPTRLEMDLHETAGRFRQVWQVYAPSAVSLPGNLAFWPRKVMIDGRPALVTVNGDQPGVKLAPGRHEVEGEFFWSALPEVLSIPENTGLVFLTLNGERINFPDIDPGGRLFLKKSETSAGKPQKREDRLDVTVFRRITDRIPMELLTRIELKAAGSEREIFLGPVLSEGFIPMNLSSPLPARLEPDGRLRLKIRTGNWTIEVLARNTADMTSLTAEKIAEPWPKEEVWVFEPQNQFRLVEVKGLLSIDPHQTTMPENWKNLPAYRVLPGDGLVLHVVRRGDPDPSPDQLHLERNFWLDFDGTGYTLQDHITGTMTRGWRLEMNPEIRLGKVVIDGAPQFITQMENTEKQGVEVRRGALNLIADSRYEKRIGALPATGWDHDFVQVDATLHLPPGWELISARGADFAGGTWLSQWTLMDIFLVLIIAVGFHKLWGRRWGAGALLTMMLIWREPHAPQYVWLNILAAVALLRVLPEGRFKRVTVLYRNGALFALILIGVPFMVAQVRTGLFPQLDNRFRPIAAPIAQQFSAPATGEGEIEMEKAVRLPLSDRRSVKKALSSDSAGSSLDEIQSQARAKRFDQIDPDAVVQTGPGIPQWQWRSIPLKWNGPVKRLQQIHLVLLSPRIMLLVHFAAFFMLLSLCLMLFKTVFYLKWPKFYPIKPHSAAVFLIIGMIFLSPQSVKAGFPSQELLNELKTKLLEPPECVPNCAQIPRMALDIDENSLVIRMEIHAMGSVAVPLPGKAGQWLPDRIMDDGMDAKGLYRSENGELWMQLDAGIHQVVLSGPLPVRDSVQLRLSLKPRYLSYTAKKWIVRGVGENGIADDQLQIERIGEASEEKTESLLEPNIFMPFVRIERNLLLGLDWHVETRVIRVSPQQTAVVIEVPLLPGESVTTAGFSVKNGNVLVNMGPDQQSLTWRSALKKQPELTLTAPHTLTWVEVWRADISTLWHSQASGINVVHHQDPQGQWFPEWRPWPGETLTLRTFRPKGVQGQSMTIDDSRITVTPGRRAVDGRLIFTLNSSRGAQHTLRLPEQTELQSVVIDGLSQPIRQKGRDVTVPVVPGKQTVEMAFRSSDGISGWFKTPAVTLGVPSTNHSIALHPGTDRWILWAWGPRMGPAVLFWGVLIVILIMALLLGRTEQTPLKTWQWLLLGIGLSQTSVLLGLIVVGWIFGLAARKNMHSDTSAHAFNLIQLGLGILTLAALSALFFAVQKGLLGLPEMQISGNQSTAFGLNWFSDRVGMTLPQASIGSLPLPAYRVCMLLWALWLAFSLVGWLRWGWQCLSANGIWRKMPLREKKTGGKANSEDNGAADTQ